jgi:hypothetical protein
VNELRAEHSAASGSTLGHQFLQDIQVPFDGIIDVVTPLD